MENLVYLDEISLYFMSIARSVSIQCFLTISGRLASTLSQSSGFSLAVGLLAIDSRSSRLYWTPAPMEVPEDEVEVKCWKRISLAYLVS